MGKGGGTVIYIYICVCVYVCGILPTTFSHQTPPSHPTKKRDQFLLKPRGTCEPSLTTARHSLIYFVRRDVAKNVVSSGGDSSHAMCEGGESLSLI